MAAQSEEKKQPIWICPKCGQQREELAYNKWRCSNCNETEENMHILKYDMFDFANRAKTSIWRARKRTKSEYIRDELDKATSLLDLITKRCKEW